MNQVELTARTRAYTRDPNGNIFTQNDVKAYINEGIDRFRSFPELSGMVYLNDPAVQVSILPQQYHYLLAVYAANRCFAQDEQYFEATSLINEFESKFDELKQMIKNGELIIKDDTGVVIEPAYIKDAVIDEYFVSTSADDDNDLFVDDDQASF